MMDVGVSNLQWGRNLFVAESPAAAPFHTCENPFNGAATCSLRKAIRPPFAGFMP